MRNLFERPKFDKENNDAEEYIKSLEEQADEKRAEKEKGPREAVEEILEQKKELTEQQKEEQIRFQDEIFKECKTITDIEEVLYKYGGLARFNSEKGVLEWWDEEMVLSGLRSGLKVKESGEGGQEWLRHITRSGGLRSKVKEIEKGLVIKEEKQGVEEVEEPENKIDVFNKQKARERVGEILKQKHELTNKQKELQVEFQEDDINNCETIDELKEIIRKYEGLTFRQSDARGGGLEWRSAIEVLRGLDKGVKEERLRQITRAGGLRDKVKEILAKEGKIIE